MRRSGGRKWSSRACIMAPGGRINKADCVYEWDEESEIQYTKKWITGLDIDVF
jgi:hypothetical protein